MLPTPIHPPQSQDNPIQASRDGVPNEGSNENDRYGCCRLALPSHILPQSQDTLIPSNQEAEMIKPSLNRSNQALSPNVTSFVHDLVEMAKAMKEVPALESRIREMQE